MSLIKNDELSNKSFKLISVQGVDMGCNYFTTLAKLPKKIGGNDGGWQSVLQGNNSEK